MFMPQTIVSLPPDSHLPKSFLLDKPVSHRGSRFHAVQMIRHVPLLLLDELRGTRRIVEYTHGTQPEGVIYQSIQYEKTA